MIIKSGMLKVDRVLINLTYMIFVGKGPVRYKFFQEAKEMQRNKSGKLYKDDATGIFKYFKLFDDDIWLKLAEKYEEYFELK